MIFRFFGMFVTGAMESRIALVNRVDDAPEALKHLGGHDSAKPTP